MTPVAHHHHYLTGEVVEWFVRSHTRHGEFPDQAVLVFLVVLHQAFQRGERLLAETREGVSALSAGRAFRGRSVRVVSESGEGQPAGWGK